MHTTQNMGNLIEDEILSGFIQTALKDELLGEQFWYNVSDFTYGDSIKLPTFGTVTIQETKEDTPLVYTPLETGSIVLRGFEQKGDAWYITDELKEDSTPFLLAAAQAQRATESARAIQEAFETDFFNTVGEYYSANPTGNVVNGYNHLINSTGAGGAFDYRDLIALKLAFDKANVPAQGRVLFVPPEVEAGFLGQMHLTPDMNGYTLDRLKSGFTAGMRYIHEWLGFSLIVTNRLPTVTLAVQTGVNVTGVLCIAMCVADDNTKPVVGLWRRHPRTETERNKDMRRDETVVTCRYMWGIKRIDTLGAIIVAADTYKVLPSLATVEVEPAGVPSDPTGAGQPGQEPPAQEPPVSGGD